MTDRDYQHSRILDVHRRSEHPEANLFVDEVYDTFLNRQELENVGIKKKHQQPQSVGYGARPGGSRNPGVGSGKVLIVDHMWRTNKLLL